MLTGITAVIFVEYLQAFVIEAFVWNFGRHFTTKHLFFKKKLYGIGSGKTNVLPLFLSKLSFFLK
jgi:hypothetical protein